MTKGFLWFVAVFFWFGWSCASERKGPRQKPCLVATTAMLGDAVQAVFGDRYEVYVLMGPGTDPHAYRPSPQDAAQLKNAVLIFSNGAHLEGKMSRLWPHLQKQKTILEADFWVPDSLRIVHEGETDPHFWFDPLLWRFLMDHMMTKAAELLPLKSHEWKQQKSAYLDTLDAVYKEGLDLFSNIPISGRMLVSTHDAFSYFGHRFGFTLWSLQGTSTLSGYGNYDINLLARDIKNRNIPTVFGEQHQPGHGMEAVIRQAAALGHSLRMAPPLLTDAPAKDQPTVAAMWRYNFRGIAQALSSNFPHDSH
jgi:manganese/zinc/iron transport system substrate-binding protein